MTGAGDVIARFGQRAPDALVLARCVSLAVRIEPRLLRLARRRFRPDCGPEVEADLWLGPLVQTRNVLGVTFFPEVAAELRARLVEEGPLDEAWAMVRACHAGAPAPLRLEEQIAYLTLAGRRDQAEGLLRSALASVLVDERREVAAWALRALPRLPEAARVTAPARMTAIAASARLGGRAILADELARDPVPTASWLVPRETARLPLWLRLVDQRLEVSATPLIGAHLAPAAATQPLLVAVTPSSFDTQTFSVPSGDVLRVLVPSEADVVVRTAPDVTLRLRRVIEPVPTRVVLIAGRDARSHELATALRTIGRLGDGAHVEWHEPSEGSIALADRVIALVRDPEERVGWALGIALALHKPLQIAYVGGEPEWMSERRPFGEATPAIVSDLFGAAALLTAPSGAPYVPSPFEDQFHDPLGGYTSLLLCPEDDAGTELRKFVPSFRGDSSSFWMPEAGASLARVSHVQGHNNVDGVLWVLTERSTTTATRFANALLAAAAFAVGCPVQVMRAPNAVPSGKDIPLASSPLASPARFRNEVTEWHLSREVRRHDATSFAASMVLLAAPLRVAVLFSQGHLREGEEVVAGLRARGIDALGVPAVARLMVPESDYRVVVLWSKTWVGEGRATCWESLLADGSAHDRLSVVRLDEAEFPWRAWQVDWRPDADAAIARVAQRLAPRPAESRVLVLAESRELLSRLLSSPLAGDHAMIEYDTAADGDAPRLHAVINRGRPAVALFVGSATPGARERRPPGTIVVPSEIRLRYPSPSDGGAFAQAVPMSARLIELSGRLDLAVTHEPVAAGDAGLRGLPPLDLTASRECFLFATAMRRHPEIEALAVCVVDDREGVGTIAIGRLLAALGVSSPAAATPPPEKETMKRRSAKPTKKPSSANSAKTPSTKRRTTKKPPPPRPKKKK